MPAPQDYHYQHEAILHGCKPGAAHHWERSPDRSGESIEQSWLRQLFLAV